MEMLPDLGRGALRKLAEFLVLDVAVLLLVNGECCFLSRKTRALRKTRGLTLLGCRAELKKSGKSKIRRSAENQKHPRTANNAANPTDRDEAGEEVGELHGSLEL